MIKSQNYFYNYDTNLQFTAKLYNKIHKTIITKRQAFERLLKKLSKKVDWLLKWLQFQWVQGIENLPNMCTSALM